MTKHEEAARRGFAELSRRPESQWRIVHQPEVGVWYDWFDPATRRYGQCCMGEGGRWKQDPRGEQPVVLCHMKHINPRAIGLIRVRAKQIAKARHDASANELAFLARDAAARLCSEALRPGGGVTFDEAVEVAALVECWVERGTTG